MAEQCSQHKKPVIFCCCESTCYKLLCLSCINDHQKNCHSNNTYQDLRLFEDLPEILDQRVDIICEKVSKIFLHKKDLLLNYFFDQISEITKYYFENLNKSISLEPLDIVQLTGSEFFKETKEKIKHFREKKEKNEEDCVNILKETETISAIEKIKKTDINSAKRTYPDLNKKLEEIQNILNEIELCFLDFKKKIFAESYANEMNQMLNFVAQNEEKNEKEKQELVFSEHKEKTEKEKQEEVVFSEHEIQQMLLTMEENKMNKETLEENKTDQNEANKVVEHEIEKNEVIPNSLEIVKNEIYQNNFENQIYMEENKEIILKDPGVFLDYELEAFEYELESLNPDNRYLFLYHIPDPSSNYFIDILDLGCKRIFGDDFFGVISTDEATLKAENYKTFSTSGEINLVENVSEEFGVYHVCLEFQDQTKNDFVFKKQGLQLILPNENDFHLHFLKDDSEKKIINDENFLKNLVQKYGNKLKENILSRSPLHFHFHKYLIQINESFDKLRIIDKTSGFRVFLRNFDQSLSLKDFNSEQISEYIFSNCTHALHFEDLDIFLDSSQHLNFIVLNRKFDDIMICNLMTPEVVMFYFDIFFQIYRNEEIALETLIKNYLFNSNIKFKSFNDGIIYSPKLEILLENGEIETIVHAEHIEIISCNITWKIVEKLKVKTMYVLKHAKRLILAYDDNTTIKLNKENESKKIAPYDEELTNILRIAQFFLKINIKNVNERIVNFEDHFIIYPVSDNSSFFVKNLKEEDKSLQIFSQNFDPDPNKYKKLTEKFRDELQKQSNIYRETDHIQFLYKIRTQELFVRWYGSIMNLFNLANKKNAIVTNSKQIFRKKDREKRPETKPTDILVQENELVDTCEKEIKENI